MMKLSISIATLAMFLVSSAGAKAASFDCSKAATVDEHVVCDHRLWHLDDLLPRAFAQAKAATPEEDFRQYARDFIASRHACGGDCGCILGNYVGILTDYRDHGAEGMDLSSISATMVAGGRAPASGALPLTIRHCVTTTVTDSSPRIDTFDSGTEIGFANDGKLVSYNREER